MELGISTKMETPDFSSQYVENSLLKRLRRYFFFILIFLVVLFIEVSTGIFKFSWGQQWSIDWFCGGNVCFSHVSFELG